MSHPSMLGDWTELVTQLDAANRPLAWSHAPALAGLTTVQQLQDWTATGRPARADAVLGALVRLAAAHGGNDADAVLVLLHLLWPGADRLARKFRRLHPDPESLVAGELAIQIRRFPFQRRARATAANLLMDTQHAIWRELRPYRTDLPGRRPEKLVDPIRDGIPACRGYRSGGATAAGDWGVGLLDEPYTDPADCDDLDLVDLLLWARRTGAVDPVDLAVLVELEYVREMPEVSPQRYVAEARGWTVRTVQRRRDRALAALRACAPAYLAAA